MVIVNQIAFVVRSLIITVTYHQKNAVRGVVHVICLLKEAVVDLDAVSEHEVFLLKSIDQIFFQVGLKLNSCLEMVLIYAFDQFLVDCHVIIIPTLINVIG